MMKRSLIAIAIVSALCTARLSSAATIPAGTILHVRTIDVVSSHDRAGRIFVARLDRNVEVNGHIVLHASTELFGRIEKSRRYPHRSEPLTLNLISISVSGKKVPIKTTGGFQVEQKPKTARQARRDISAGPYTLPSGTKMAFRLAEPVSL